MVPKWVITSLWIVLVVVFATTAFLTILSIINIVKIEGKYENALFTSLILELITMSIGFLKSSSKSGRSEKCHKNLESIQNHLQEIISSANSSITIFSNTFGWVDKKIGKLLQEKAKSYKVTLYIPKINEKVRSISHNTDIAVCEYPILDLKPDFRFTLLDKDFKGAERIAVGQGIPNKDFRITVFESSYDPQIVALSSFLINIIDKITSIQAFG